MNMLLLLAIIMGGVAVLSGVYAGIGLTMALLVLGMLFADYEKSVIILSAYAFIDFVLRNFVPAFAGIWDELLLILMIMLWIYKSIVYYKERIIRQAPLDLFLFIYIAVMFMLFVYNSPDYTIALEGFRANVQYTLWYFVALQLLRTEKTSKNVCMALSLFVGIMALHGIYQYIIGVEMPAGWVDQNEAGVRTRVFSILTSPNIFGSLLTLTAPICFALGVTTEKRVKKAILIILSLCMAIALVFTFSRGAWIGFAVAVAIYVLIKDAKLIIPCAIFALLVIILVPSVGNRIAYMLSPEYIESSLRGGRLVRWWTGLQILSQNPLVGVGIGHFGGAVAINHNLSTLAGTAVIKTFYMDNYFLKTAVESGIIGFIAFVVLMFEVFITSLRTIKAEMNYKINELEVGILAGLSGVIIHNFVENVFEVPLMASLFWLMAAVMMSFWYINDRKTEKRHKENALRRRQIAEETRRHERKRRELEEKNIRKEINVDELSEKDNRIKKERNTKTHQKGKNRKR